MDDSISIKTPTYMLTTLDNPFDPLTEFDNWLRFDEDHGYYSLNYLCRVAPTSDYLTDAENQRILNAAIDDIIRLDLTGNYTKVLVD